jgi:hypothetical protein
MATALTDGYVAGLLASAIIIAAADALVALVTINARLSAAEAAGATEPAASQTDNPGTYGVIGAPPATRLTRMSHAPSWRSGGRRHCSLVTRCSLRGATLDERYPPYLYTCRWHGTGQRARSYRPFCLSHREPWPTRDL